MSILLNVQYWERDRAQAMQLVRLITDLEDNFREDVGILFTARFDCVHDLEAIKYASTRFRCHRFTTRRRATGWPNGPNQMMGDSYLWIIESIRNKTMPPYDCILFVEADCVPLHKNWISILYNEWKTSGKDVSGAWLKRGDAGVEHVNGNCIISRDFWKKDKGIFHPVSRGGWDATMARSILPNAHPSAFIWSDYQLGQAHNPWRGCDFLFEAKRYGSPSNALYGKDLYPVWFHGLKVMDGLKCVRERLINEPKNKKA